jgi:16S rRNA G1207 methylase RsmC
MNTDVYLHKVLPYRAWKQEVLFRTSMELFSSHDVDTGSKFLLRTIVEAGYPAPQSILDMGCGYGPLGLTLKKLHPDCAVHLVDRDALAVEYSRENADLNNFTAVEAYGSLGYDDVPKHDFDLVVSNIPGKAGEPVITYLLQEPQFFLKPGGLAAIVVVTPLETLAAKILAETPGVEVLLKRDRPGHTVFHYRFAGSNEPASEKSSLERGIYARKTVTMRPGKLVYQMQTAYGLPEFDSLSYDTELLIKTLEGFKGKEIGRALVFNPGQGHIPAALWRCCHPRTISLTGRDLLALRYSQINLLLNGYPPEAIKLDHNAGLDPLNHEHCDLITGVLPEENKEALQLAMEAAALILNPNGRLVIAGGSTAITRLETLFETTGTLTAKARERRRGYSVLVMVKI